MRLHDKIRATVVTGLLAAGTLAVTASPALAANAPGCIDDYGTGHHTSVIVANNCPQGAGYYLKVVWAAAPDSGCFWLASGQQTRVNGDSRYPFIEFDKVVVC